MAQLSHRDFGIGAPPRTPASESAARRWWTLDGKAAADAVTATLTLLEASQRQRAQQLTISARLYGNHALLGGAGTALSRVLAANPGMRDRVTYNAIQSATDTVTAKIAKNKPKPLYLTTGGNYRQQRKAKLLNKFTEGIFYENTLHELAVMAFRDACVWGDGILHVFAREEGTGAKKGPRVRYERVLPQELWVDEIEAMYGTPRQMHRVKQVDRALLLEMFPDAAEAIGEANGASVLEAVARPNVSDLVTVRESWHLPSGPGADDGAHILTVEGGALTKREPWKHDFFPFARFQWSPRLFGFWAQGLAEQVQGLQLELNKLMWIIQRSFQLAGTFKVLLEASSKVVTEHLNNDVGAIIKYQGTKPEYVTVPIAAVEYFQQVLNLKQSIYEQAGISQLSASGVKPAGLNSGEAQRVYNDIESERFMPLGQRYEQFHLDVGRLSIAAMKDALGGRKTYRVRTPGGKFLREIDWKEIDLDEDEYVMQCFPVSSLPSEPAGRLQTIQEWVQAGWLDPDEGRRLQNLPDLEQVESLAEAQEDRILQMLDNIMFDGTPEQPEAYDNLELAHKLALRYYARGQTQDLEPDRLELLRRFIDGVVALKLKAAPPPMPAGPGAAPQAVPMPPPQSDLIPNVPAPAGVPLQ